MSADYWLTTERLGLRRFTPADIDWFVELYSDPDVTRYLGGTRDRPRATELFNTRILQYYDENPGLGIWATVERATGTRVGFHLLNNIQGETLIQVGYALTRPAWGKGMATEMAAAVLRYGFVDLSLPNIAGIASRQGERAFPHPAYAAEGPMAWFERDRAAWLAERPG
jgi:ribosomal-protein-alanine N-acetyltransferase